MQDISLWYAILNKKKKCILILFLIQNKLILEIKAYFFVCHTDWQEEKGILSKYALMLAW